MTAKSILFLAQAILILLTGCRSEPKPTPTGTRTPGPAPLSITYCDINPSDLCLEGFGLDIDDRLLILFKADDSSFTDIYIHADVPDGEMIFECRQSEQFIENVYCLGEIISEGELIKLNIYSNSNDRLIAIGVFNVQYSALPIRDVVFEGDATATPSSVPVSTLAPASTPSYPNPGYPNPSYPNPTSTP